MHRRWSVIATAALGGLGLLAFVLLGFRFGWIVIPNSAQARAARCLAPDATGKGVTAGMVWVPAGRFNMGDTVYPDEGPIKRVSTSGFWMDRHEVTNAEFAAFVKATSYVTVAERPVDRATHSNLPPDMLRPGGMVFVMPKAPVSLQDIAAWWRYVPGANWRHPGGPGTSIAGHENYPVVQVTEEDARAYARWKGHSLPTEVEWEWAARAGRPRLPDHEQPKNANTWQGVFPVRNSAEDGFVGLAPAGCYAPNKFGLYDMIGNVWELTASLYRPHPGETPGPDAVAAPTDDPEIPRYVIKGGSYLCAPNYCMRYRAGAREPQEADLAASHLGFRTIYVPKGPAAK